MAWLHARRNCSIGRCHRQRECCITNFNLPQLFSRRNSRVSFPLFYMDGNSFSFHSLLLKKFLGSVNLCAAPHS